MQMAADATIVTYVGDVSAPDAKKDYNSGIHNDAVDYINCETLATITTFAGTDPKVYTVKCVAPPALDTATEGTKECADDTACTYKFTARVFDGTTITGATDVEGWSYFGSSTGGCYTSCSNRGEWLTDKQLKKVCKPMGGEEFFTAKRAALKEYMLGGPSCVNYGSALACDEKNGNQGSFLKDDANPAKFIDMNYKLKCLDSDYVMVEGSGASHLVVSMMALLLSFILFA
jgi:hypothetical protein